MKFMLLMSAPRNVSAVLATWTQADFKSHIQFMLGFAKELERSGELVLAEGLDMPDKAKLVIAKKESAPTVSDGPFAESKEFLAGFWIVDVETPERAIAIAARASTAPGPGGQPLGIPIELRQVMSAPKIDG